MKIAEKKSGAGRLIMAAIAIVIGAALSGALWAQSRPADFPYTGINYPATLGVSSATDCVTFCKYSYACFYRGNSGRQAEAASRHDRFMRDCRRNVCGKPANRQKALGCYNNQIHGNLNLCVAGTQCLIQAMRAN